MIKMLVYITNRIWLILGVYVMSIIIAAFLFSNAENRSFGDSIWWSVVTSLTIGYGDISPVTTFGRCVGIFFGHFWIFLVIPMVVGNIITHILDDKNEFTDGEQRELFDRIKNIEKILQSGEENA